MREVRGFNSQFKVQELESLKNLHLDIFRIKTYGPDFVFQGYSNIVRVIIN